MISHQITHQSLTQVYVTHCIKQPTYIFHIKDTDLDPAFKIENLKCRTMLAEEALEHIKSDGIYDFSPLPVTDVNEKPIPPSKYEEMLLGATVLLRFILNSDIISSKTLQFYADIESITVLQKPRDIVHAPISKSPSKKRFHVPDLAKRSKTRNA